MTPITRHEMSETAFRNFEPDIARLMKAWPEPVQITPNGMKPVTYIARFRDAVRGVILHGYHTDLDIELLSEIRSKVIFRNDEMYVYIGVPDKLKQHFPSYESSVGPNTLQVQPFVPPGTPASIRVDCSTEGVIDAVHLLKNSNQLPFDVVLYNCGTIDTQDFMTRYPRTMLIQQDKPDEYILIA